MPWQIMVLMLAAKSAAAAVGAASAAYLAVPLTTDGGGGRAASAAYAQPAGSFGGIAETAAVSAAYTGRHAYVAALPEPGVIQFAVARTTIARSDPGVVLAVVRDGDEDSPIAVPYTTDGGSPAPGDVLLPGSGEVVFADVTALTVPLPLALNRHVDDGVDASFNVRLGLPAGEAELGAQRTSRVFVTAVVRDDGLTHPLITTTPPVLTATGDRWVYEVAADVSGLQLAHSLTTQFALDWALLTTETGVRLERTGPITARVTWDPASGSNDHHSLRIQVVDRVSGLADWQEVLIYVVRAPQGDG